MTPLRPHRIARLYHTPRTLGFALAFGASLFLFIEGLVAWNWLWAGVLILLVYPHLAYERARRARDGKAAELQHLFLDAFLLGLWVAIIGFNAGLAFALLSAVCLNNAMLGGWRRLGVAAALYGGGAVVGFLAAGRRFDPAASEVATVLGMLGILIYMVVVALLFHQQNALMMRVNRQNEQRRQVSERLARSGLETGKAEDLDTLLRSMLSHLQAVLPEAQGMGLVVREDRRPSVVHGACFRGYDDKVQRHWVQSSSAVPTASGPHRIMCPQHGKRPVTTPSIPG